MEQTRLARVRERRWVHEDTGLAINSGEKRDNQKEKNEVNEGVGKLIGCFS